MNQPKRRRGEPAVAHGTRGRYRYWGCRCDACSEAERLYTKRMRTGRLGSAYIDPTGTIRRVQGLIAIGWTATEIARRLDVQGAWIRQLAHGRTGPCGIYQRTADDIVEVARHVLTLTPPSGRAAAVARTVAHRNGWSPLHAWDDDTIDDPAAQPNLGGTGDDVVDEVAIRRALDGQLPFGQLRKAEKAALFRDHAATLTGEDVGRRLGVAGSTVRKWRERVAA